MKKVLSLMFGVLVPLWFWYGALCPIACEHKMKTVHHVPIKLLPFYAQDKVFVFKGSKMYLLRRRMIDARKERFAAVEDALSNYAMLPELCKIIIDYEPSMRSLILERDSSLFGGMDRWVSTMHTLLLVGPDPDAPHRLIGRWMTVIHPGIFSPKEYDEQRFMPLEKCQFPWLGTRESLYRCIQKTFSFSAQDMNCVEVTALRTTYRMEHDDTVRHAIAQFTADTKIDYAVFTLLKSLARHYIAIVDLTHAINQRKYRACMANSSVLLVSISDMQCMMYMQQSIERIQTLRWPVLWRNRNVLQNIGECIIQFKKIIKDLEADTTGNSRILFRPFPPLSLSCTTSLGTPKSTEIS